MQNDINNSLDSPFTETPNSPSPNYRNTNTATKINNASSKQQSSYPVLGVKMSRPCNVVSFSQSHPNLLACGLDKVRNDPCLLVWDVSQAIDGYDTSSPSISNLTGKRETQR